MAEFRMRGTHAEVELSRNAGLGLAALAISVAAAFACLKYCKPGEAYGPPHRSHMAGVYAPR